MKTNQSNNLVALLNRIKGDLDVISNPESKAAFRSSLDELISRLISVRERLENPAICAKLSEIARPLDQVIDLLECAKNDELLSILLADTLGTKSTSPKRVPIEIPAGLQNDEIRKLLRQELSRQELKALAALRGISMGKANEEKVKRDILRALDRQDGYERLASRRRAE